MKQIQTIALIGLGAVGINFAYYLNRHLPKGALRIVADKKRTERYRSEGCYYNEERCDFLYADENNTAQAVDLVLFCTKANGLRKACETIKAHCDKDTLFMSAVNGITSEAVLAEYFNRENIIYTVAQGMDATKVGNHVECHTLGELCFGAVDSSQNEAVNRIHEFFDDIGFSHTLKQDIIHHQWGKFMLNCGLNQVVALHCGTYETIQQPGEARTQMLAAMKEVQQLSVYEGIHLTEQEITKWAAMCDTLSATGRPSMAQDVLAKRRTEVDLFAAEVIRRCAKFQLSCPVNTMLYERLTALESTFPA